jgi:thioredoxin reductase
MGIRLIETPIACLSSEDGQLQEIVFADGSRLPRRALFIRPLSSQHSPLALDLGCATDEWGLVKVDEVGRTNIPGVYAAGDMTTRLRQLIIAAKSGASAAMGINYDLIHELVS